MQKQLGRALVFWAVLAAGLCGASAVAAQERADSPDSFAWGFRIGTKLVRGVANFATGWVELPKQIYLIGRDEGWGTAIWRGPFDSVGMFMARTVAGAYEIVTFPVPLPPRYQALLAPEYVWQPEPADRDPR